MTERKPPGVTWETWIDSQVRRGMEEGAFDNLPGHGKPLPGLDRPRDELSSSTPTAGRWGRCASCVAGGCRSWSGWTTT